MIDELTEAQCRLAGVCCFCKNNKLIYYKNSHCATLNDISYYLMHDICNDCLEYAVSKRNDKVSKRNDNLDENVISLLLTAKLIYKLKQ